MLGSIIFSFTRDITLPYSYGEGQVTVPTTTEDRLKHE